MSGSSNLKSYYNVVFDQQFSPLGKHLATSDIFGQIAVFSLSSALDSTNPLSGKTASRLLKGHKGPAYSLCNADTLLVSGGTHEIRAWKWEELTSNSESVDPLITLTPPINASATDINGLTYDKQSQTIFSACGNGKLYSWDLSAGKLKGTFAGHKGCAYCVTMRTGSQQFLSGGEDGSVYVWDPSASNAPVHTIKAEDAQQWIGCIAVDQSGEWMVYGGSAAPVVYHLGSMNKILSLPVPDGVISQGAIFAKDNIITVGSEPTVRHWTVNGLPVAAVPGGHSHAFSVAFNDSSTHYEVLAVSGDSSDINVFTNFGYKAFSLTVC